MSVEFDRLTTFMGDFVAGMAYIRGAAITATAAASCFGRARDRAMAEAYRRETGRRPPGSWSTKRLAKKRRAALAARFYWGMVG